MTSVSDEAVVRHLTELADADFAMIRLRQFAPLDALSPEGLTNLQALALFIYTTPLNFHQRINAELWSGAPSETVRFFTGLIDDALAKLPVHKGPVFRGYSPPEFDAFSRAYTESAEIEWRGLTSCAVRPENAFSAAVLFEIWPKNARIIWPYSAEWHEGEVLIPSGAHVRVLGVDRRGEMSYIVVEEI